MQELALWTWRNHAAPKDQVVLVMMCDVYVRDSRRGVTGLPQDLLVVMVSTMLGGTPEGVAEAIVSAEIDAARDRMR